MDLSRVALLQLNTTPGDIDGNYAAILAAAHEAAAAGAQLAVTPELALVGYSPRDLLFRRRFVEAAADRMRALAGEVSIPLIVGTVALRTGRGRPFSNVAVLLEGGQERARWEKRLLPNYDIFDEARYFEPGPQGPVVTVAGTRIGVTICEDLWVQQQDLEVPRYSLDPAASAVAAGAELIINLSASPYSRGKPAVRHELVHGTALRLGVPVALCNLVGGNDELIFDGNSVVLRADGSVIAQGPHCSSAVVLGHTVASSAVAGSVAEVRAALVLGIRDYVNKCGFPGVLLGLSGGIDSAVCACLCAEALGPKRVRGLLLPSEFSSEGSLTDARALTKALGMPSDELPIDATNRAALSGLERVLGTQPFGLMQENLQARVRGLLLMGMSNSTGWMLVTTGNKSELATGYCTLYGDMCGGLAPIGDVWKTEVYALAEGYAAEGLLPRASIDKAPSAELRPNQTDQDSLPPYEMLDQILRFHIENGMGARAIIEAAPLLQPALVEQVLRLVAGSEHKRRQAAPGLKVSAKAFGTGRRIPLVAASRAFHDWLRDGTGIS